LTGSGIPGESLLISARGAAPLHCREIQDSAAPERPRMTNACAL